MLHIKKVSETLGYNVKPFSLNGKFYKCDGRRKGNKALWMLGKEWQFNGKDYWVVYCGNFSIDTSYKVVSWDERDISIDADVLKESKAILKALEKDAKKEREKKAKECKEKWEPKYNDADPNPVHDYMLSKGFSHNYKGRNFFNGMFIVPVYSFDGFEGVQIIRGEDKKFSTGIRKKGSFCTLGFNEIESAQTVYFVEGFATGCSVWEAINAPVVVCFDCGNLQPVIDSYREKYPNMPFVICADNDQYKTGNPGRDKAVEVCKKVSNCDFVYPEFKDTTKEPTDFNDLHQQEGLPEVRKQILKENDDPFFNIAQMGFTSIGKRGKITRHIDKLTKYFKHTTHSFYLLDTDTIYVWDKTHYKPIMDNFVKHFAQTHLNPPCERDQEAVEFVKSVKRSYPTTSAQISKKLNDNIINFKNGMLNWKTGEFLKHNTDYFVTSCLPVNYDPNAQCPTWMDLMDLVTMNRGHLQNIVEEFLGYCILGGSYDLNNILILKGGGSNGKTTVLNIMRKILGDENCSAISLTEIATNRFLTVNLEHKLANFSEEEDKKVFKDTGMLKKLSGKSPVKAEQKGKPVYTFENRAKLIMSYNEMPQLCDFSEGIRRRLLIVPFDIDLEENPHMKIENINHIIEEDLSGIVNRALAGLKRLELQGNFTRAHETSLEFKQLELNSDPFLEWWEENVTYSENDNIFINSLKASYEEFIGESVSNQKLGKLINKMIHRAEREGFTITRRMARQNGIPVKSLTGCTM